MKLFNRKSAVPCLIERKMSMNKTKKSTTTFANGYVQRFISVIRNFNYSMLFLRFLS